MDVRTSNVNGRRREYYFSPFGEADSCESKETLLDGDPDSPRERAAAKHGNGPPRGGHKTAMRPFAKLLRALVIVIIIKLS